MVSCSQPSKARTSRTGRPGTMGELGDLPGWRPGSPASKQLVHGAESRRAGTTKRHWEYLIEARLADEEVPETPGRTRRSRSGPSPAASSMPRPTDTPPACTAPLLAASMMPGPARPVINRVARPDQARRAMALGGQVAIGSSRGGPGPEPKIDTAGPRPRPAGPKPSTNSAWIPQQPRHGSVCTQSVGPRRVQQPADQWWSPESALPTQG